MTRNLWKQKIKNKSLGHDSKKMNFRNFLWRQHFTTQCARKKCLRCNLNGYLISITDGVNNIHLESTL